jgi:hypothetical protein
MTEAVPDSVPRPVKAAPVMPGTLLLCFLPHEMVKAEDFAGSGCAADIHGVRHHWAASASIAGIAQAAFGPEGYAQRRSR